MTHRRFAALLAAAALSVLPVACGSDDDDSGGGGGSADTSAPAKLDLALKETSGGSTITAPDSVEAGPVEITFQNSGKKPHDLQLVRVEGDHTPEDVKKVVQSERPVPIPEWLRGGGGLGTVPPGKSGTSIDLLEPGRYVVLDTESGPKGGTAEFEVTGEAGGELPSTEATITAKDYSFDTSGLKAGKNRVTFENAGKELHHVIAFPLRPGATVAEAKKVFESEDEPKGPPPVDFEKGVGTAVLDGGVSQVVDLELQKGKYALVCFITDRKGGPPHVAKGMISEATVE